MTVDAGFRPCALARNRHLQSILASSRLRVLSKRSVLEGSEERVVATPAGSRLQSFITHHPAPKGLVILLHGWEGSSSSPYMIDAGAHFLRLGYSVCRLNLRDHGESHHLNEGLFHGALLEETFDAVDALAALAGGKPAWLAGFSLGGNFALRIARRYSDLGRSRLRGVFAISPPLDPYKSTLCIDNGLSIYRHYFLRKWKRSLARKQELFPHRYDFGGMLGAKTCIELTERLMRYYPDYPTYRDYFDSYTLRDDFFRDLRVPVTVFISGDDPVIPPEDYDALSGHGNLRVVRTAYGGHCGFLDLFPMRCWCYGVIEGLIG
jgi:predicted alpha/beta-fold hydrolase